MKESFENISVFIITYNEEVNLPYCIDSVLGSDDIVILDSFSNDMTKDIALSYPVVRFFQHSFKDFSTQRNYGLNNIMFKNKWVFIIDADERCTSELWNEMLTTINSSDDSVVSYSLRRKLYFQGKWMKHNTMYPVWVERLVIPQNVRFEGDVHERLISNGKQELLNEHLIHLSFSKGISHWIQRMNNYTTFIASENRIKKNINITKIFQGNPLEKRRTVKMLFYKCRYRWLIFLIINIFFKWCFLDGRKGIKYVVLCSFTEYIASLKEKEIPEKYAL